MKTAEIETPAEAIGLLSSMYLCEPSREVLENWKRALAEDTSILLADLKRAIDGINLDSEEAREFLLSEYTRLFIGPYKLPCPPWESVYTSPKRLMMQDAADQVRKIYGEAGLTLNSSDVMPDHIGAELNFLALLLRRRYSGTDKKDEYIRMTKELLEGHLHKWLPKFTSDMEDAAETPFFRALARATRQVLDIIGR